MACARCYVLLQSGAKTTTTTMAWRRNTDDFRRDTARRHGNSIPEVLIHNVQYFIIIIIIIYSTPALRPFAFSVSTPAASARGRRSSTVARWPASGRAGGQEMSPRSYLCAWLRKCKCGKICVRYKIPGVGLPSSESVEGKGLMGRKSGECHRGELKFQMSFAYKIIYSRGRSVDKRPTDR